jgi:hypothetical protein
MGMGLPPRNPRPKIVVDYYKKEIVVDYYKKEIGIG